MAVRTTSWTWGFPCRDVKWKWLLRSVLTYLWSRSTFHHSIACFSLKEEKMHVYSATWLLPSRRTLHCPRSMSSCLSRSLSWSTQREREREGSINIFEGHRWSGGFAMVWLPTSNIPRRRIAFLFPCNFLKLLGWTFVSLFLFFVFKQYFKKN